MEVLLTWMMIGLVVSFIVVSLMYPVVVQLINYLFRAELDIGGFERFKEELTGIKDIRGVQFLTVTFGVISLFVMTVVIGAMDEYNISFGDATFLATTYMMYLLCIASSLPLTRWLIDVARNLKVKSSTGDSQKLKELQDQINELKKEK